MASGPYLCTPPDYVFEVFSHNHDARGTYPHVYVEYYAVADGYRVDVRNDDGDRRAIDATNPAVYAFLMAFVDAVASVAA